MESIVRQHGKSSSSGTGVAVTDRLGRPLRDLRVSLTDECNFRCTYCMPEELFGEGHPFLNPRNLLSFDEIENVVRHAAAMGVQKVKITGGEPLLRPGVHTLVRSLREIPGIDDIGLITNGYHLATVAQRLRDAGLERVTVSLDSIDPDTFDRIVGRGGGLNRVLAGIRTARDVGMDPVKVNMVVQRGINDGEILEMAEFGRREGVEMRFIEYMDVGRRNEYNRSLLVPNREVRDTIHARYPLVANEPAYYGEVAETYAYRDGTGRVGFVSSMTQPFCGSCTRLRLSADGKLFRCLFSGIGLDLRSILRDPDQDDETRNLQLDTAVRRFWGIREDRYSERRAEEKSLPGSRREERVEMYRMGG
ncbi:MAG: GTP 3',8-cyclase MoaA [Spirochaeta sp.]|jgi:cyclic pyranopterin phosphate synthase|nr:GTP 3',8-cyclase MoaA [Spirochaeta sp.]